MTNAPGPAGLGPLPVALLLGCLIGLSGMGSAAVAVALPAIVDHFDVPADRGVWVISAYAITLAVGTALYGRAADNAGIRTPLGIGVGLLALGALAASLAPSYGALIGARLLQGAGAGAAMGGFLGVNISMLLDMQADRKRSAALEGSQPSRQVDDGK